MIRPAPKALIIVEDPPQGEVPEIPVALPVDEDGNFIFEIWLSPGTFHIQVETLDADGNVQYSSDIETIEMPEYEAS